MRLAPGSFLWLAAHDVRLNWRRFADMLGGASVVGLMGLFVGGILVLHLVAWPALLLLEPHIHGDDATIMPIATAVFCIFTWMIAQGLFSVTRTLYDRGDLDLLLGSPLPAARILAAKAAAIAASTFGSIALLVVPLANVGALLGEPAWLAVYPTLVALALIATSLGLGLSIGLFFLLGARRARLYTQMTGAVIAGAFVLGAQIVAILPHHMRDAIAGWLAAVVARQGLVRDAVFLPVEAALGDGRAVVVLLAAGLGLFALAVNVLATRSPRQRSLRQVRRQKVIGHAAARGRSASAAASLARFGARSGGCWRGTRTCSPSSASRSSTRSRSRWCCCAVRRCRRHSHSRRPSSSSLRRCRRLSPGSWCPARTRRS